MSKFKKLYSTNINQNEGSFKDLLKRVKEITELKLGLKDWHYEEIIPFTNIAYTEDFVCGFSLTKSSVNLEEFNYKNEFRNDNVNLVYFSNENYAVLRSELNSNALPSVFEKGSYEYYNWFCDNEKWRLIYTSPNDFNDKGRKQNLVHELKNGADLKIRIEMNGINFILSPNIIYFNKNNDPDNNLSINQEIFKLQELIANLNGKISILEYLSFITKTGIRLPVTLRNIIYRVINFIFRKLKINIKLTSSEINCFSLTKKIEWFIK